MKIKIHFNRINMQRKDPRVWSAHTSKSCNMSEHIEIWHKNKLVARTVFQPTKTNNPRAWFETQGTVESIDGITKIHI